MDIVAHLLVILACFVLSAFFSGSEVALLRLRQAELDRDVQAVRGPAALAARNLLASTSHLLVTILLGNNVVNILAAAVASALAVFYLGEQLGIFVATLAMTVLVLIFCEVLPKAVAARHPRRIAYGVALPLYLLHGLLRPVHGLFDHFVDPFVRWVAGGSEKEPGTSPEEFLREARRLRLSGGEPSEAAVSIIRAAADAAERTASEIMVPRTEVVAFPADMAPADLLEHVLEERYTRVLVYQGSIDHVLGSVHLKDLIALVREDEARELQSIVKPVLRVPERKPVLPLLADMQQSFVHIAVVKDEFGVTQGLLTQEDILEEIVGEIRDEFDREELLTIRPEGKNAFRALGRVKVRDFNRETGCDVPSEPGDTLSGLVFNHLGRGPRRGDVAQLDGYTIAVMDLSGTRISHVRVVRHPGRTEAPSAPEG